MGEFNGFEPNWRIPPADTTNTENMKTNNNKSYNINNNCNNNNPLPLDYIKRVTCTGGSTGSRKHRW